MNSGWFHYSEECDDNWAVVWRRIDDIKYLAWETDDLLDADAWSLVIYLKNGDELTFDIESGKSILTEIGIPIVDPEDSFTEE